MPATRRFFSTRDEDLGGATTGDESIDLPTDRPISRMWVRHHATFGTTETLTHDRVDVKADGESPIFGNLEGTFARGVAKFWTGREPTRDAAAATDFETWLYLQFGRVPADRQVHLPAPLFNSLQFGLEWTASAAPTTNTLDIIVEELRDARADQGFMKRLRRADTFDPTSEPRRTTGFKGGDNVRLGAIYIDDDGDDDNLGGLHGDVIEATYQGGEREIFSGELGQLRELQRLFYNFHDDARPTDLNAIPVDQLGGIDGALTMGQDPQLELVPDTANATGTVRIYQEDYVPLG